MSILVTGGHGQIGSELELINLSHKQLDITQEDSIKSAIDQYQPNFIINCAAYTAVDRAEQENERSLAINHLGAKKLAQVCDRNSIPLLHLSTDYVFDGTLGRAIKENDHTNPLNQYGRSKLLGELAVQEHCPQSIILRVSGVFGAHGNNFVKTILRLATEREELQVVSDQMTCPSAAKHIAEVCTDIIKHIQQHNTFNDWGIYHYCDREVISWHEFAEILIQHARQFQACTVQTIKAATSDEYPSPTKRPHYAVLDCGKIQRVFGIQQHSWQRGLPEFIERELCDSNLLVC